MKAIFGMLLLMAGSASIAQSTVAYEPFNVKLDSLLFGSKNEYAYYASLGTEAFVAVTLEQAILDLSKKKFGWLIDKQYDSLNAVLDDKLEYVHSNGWVQTKTDVINDTKSGNMVYQSVDIKEANARAYNNDVVIVTGTGTFSGIHGQPFTIVLHYTEVYIKSGNRWKLASRHSNRMP